MKVIIAGGRDFVPTETSMKFLDEFFDTYKVSEVVCGCASGADAFGREYAHQRKIKVIYFAARWNTYGKAAGPIRNEEMAKYGDILIAFKGGRGTENMIQQAEKYDLPIYKP